MILCSQRVHLLPGFVWQAFEVRQRKGIERSELTNQFTLTSRRHNTNVSFETITPSFSSLYSVKPSENAPPPPPTTRAKIRFFRTPWTHLSYSVLFENGILKPRCAFFKKIGCSNGITPRFKQCLIWQSPDTTLLKANIVNTR